MGHREIPEVGKKSRIRERRLGEKAAPEGDRFEFWGENLEKKTTKTTLKRKFQKLSTIRPLAIQEEKEMDELDVKVAWARPEKKLA